MTRRIIFMGTPEFAVPALEALMTPSTLEYEIVAVVTQPDRPSGRGKILTPSPVKLAAEKAGLKVLQPETLRDEAVVAQLAALEPEVIVVAAFGQILRRNVLELPPHGCINLHASLLPRWRGAAPIAAAIRAGDNETGITLMLMEAGLDTGPMLAHQAVPIMAHQTTATLTAELAELGAALLIETLPAWLADKIQPQPQDNHRVTLAPRLKKEAGAIDWNLPAVEIERQVRAFDPWPGTFTQGRHGSFKVLAVESLPDETDLGNSLPGTVLKQQGKVYVVTGQGVIRLVRVQPAGKKQMTAEAMINGQPDLVGTQLSRLDF